MIDGKAYDEMVQKTLREWDEMVGEKEKIVPKRRAHAREIVETLEQAERRLGKDLTPYKTAFKKL